MYNRFLKSKQLWKNIKHNIDKNNSIMIHENNDIGPIDRSLDSYKEKNNITAILSYIVMILFTMGMICCDKKKSNNENSSKSKTKIFTSDDDPVDSSDDEEPIGKNDAILPDSIPPIQKTPISIAEQVEIINKSIPHPLNKFDTRTKRSKLGEASINGDMKMLNELFQDTNLDMTKGVIGELKISNQIVAVIINPLEAIIINEGLLRSGKKPINIEKNKEKKINDFPKKIKEKYEESPDEDEYHTANTAQPFSQGKEYNQNIDKTDDLDQDEREEEEKKYLNEEVFNLLIQKLEKIIDPELHFKMLATAFNSASSRSIELLLEYKRDKNIKYDFQKEVPNNMQYPRITENLIFSKVNEKFKILAENQDDLDFQISVIDLCSVIQKSSASIFGDLIDIIFDEENDRSEEVLLSNTIAIPKLVPTKNKDKDGNIIKNIVSVNINIIHLLILQAKPIHLQKVLYRVFNPNGKSEPRQIDLSARVENHTALEFASQLYSQAKKTNDPQIKERKLCLDLILNHPSIDEADANIYRLQHEEDLAPKIINKMPYNSTASPEKY